MNLTSRASVAICVSILKKAEVLHILSSSLSAAVEKERQKEHDQADGCSGNHQPQQQCRLCAWMKRAATDQQCTDNRCNVLPHRPHAFCKYTHILNLMPSIGFKEVYTGATEDWGSCGTLIKHL